MSNAQYLARNPPVVAERPFQRVTVPAGPSPGRKARAFDLGPPQLAASSFPVPRRKDRARKNPSASPLRRSPPFVCDRFLKSRKRILNEQEKIDLLFGQPTLSGILGQSAAMLH